jgi:hypothetical protein
VLGRANPEILFSSRERETYSKVIFRTETSLAVATALTNREKCASEEEITAKIKIH